VPLHPQETPNESSRDKLTKEALTKEKISEIAAISVEVPTNHRIQNHPHRYLSFYTSWSAGGTKPQPDLKADWDVLA